MSRKSLLIILFLFLMFFVAAIVLLLTQKARFFEGATPSSTLSLENSYLFASPLVARADGEEQITISVFVLSDQGLGIPGQIVSLYSAPPLQAKAIQETTDPRGLAVFEISSTSAGRFNIWATVSAGMINQTVSVTFAQ